MVKKTLNLVWLAIVVACVTCFGLFAAVEQGPPGPVKQRLEQLHISTTDTGLAGGSIMAVAALGITVLIWNMGDRLRRSPLLAGRLNALHAHLTKIKTFASLALARFFQPHVTTSRSVRTS